MSALVCLFVIAAGSTAFAVTINVPGDQPTIQAAIDAAANGDLVAVAKGTYPENIDFKGKAITVQSTNPTDKAVVAATIIDGQKKGSVVTFKSGEKATSVLTGFTITNGSGTVVDQYGNTRGGGAYCYTSSPTVTNNTLSGNSATDGGGVGCEQGSSPALTNNTLSGNTAFWKGGGVYCCSSSPALTSNTLSGNTATHGGGVCCEEACWPVLTNNTLSGNTAYQGGGMYCCDSASPTLTNNTLSGNLVGAGGGGGVYCYVASLTLTNNTLSANSVSGNGSGGGVCCVDSVAALTNNTLSGNSAAYGGGVYCSNTSPTLTNDSLSGNSAAYGGGVYCVYDCSPIIKNTIVAFSSNGGGLYVDVTSGPCNPVITYCDLCNNTGGNYVNWPDQTGTNGNLSQDPLFADVLAGDFHEQSKGGRYNPVSKAWVVDTVHSPCIDAGDPASDFSNEPAPNGGRTNMGAYGNTPEASMSALRPDLWIRNSSGSYIGNDIYNADGTNQTKSQTVIQNIKATYCFRVQNDATVADSFTLTGPAGGADWRVKYFVAGQGEKTGDFTGTGYTTASVAAGASVSGWVEVTPRTLAASQLAVLITATSVAAPSKVDAVKAVTSRQMGPDLQIRAGSHKYCGDNIYNPDGTKQTETLTVAQKAKATYSFRLYNDENAADNFKLTGPAAATGWRVKYYIRGQGEKTSDFTGTGYAITGLASGAFVSGWVDVTPLAGGGATQEVLVTGTSTTDAAKVDAVKAVTSRNGAGLALSALSATPTRAGGAQIVFSLSAPATVQARILNLAGRPVRALCQAQACDAGANTLLWNAQSDAGLRVPNGTYLVEVIAQGADGTSSRALQALTVGR